MVEQLWRSGAAAPHFTFRAAIGQPEGFDGADLYPDARPTLARLRAAGLRIAVAGNQPLWAEAAVSGLGLPVDLVAASEGWGVHKPAPAFFARLVAEAGVPAAQIAYVGDRLDNDVLPARAAGMWAIFLRRGPWGHLHATWPERDQAHAQIEGLAALPDLLRREGEVHLTGRTPRAVSLTRSTPARGRGSPRAPRRGQRHQAHARMRVRRRLGRADPAVGQPIQM